MAAIVKREPHGRTRAVPAKDSGGFTLLELLLVILLAGILTCLAIWGGSKLAGNWRLKLAAQQIFEDLKAVQARAELTGSLTLDDGTLVMQQTFLVFDPTGRSYRAYLWLDSDGDAIEEAGEASLLWQRALPQAVRFDWTAGIDRRACSNASGPPGSAVSFNSPAYPPCSNRPCIRFDSHGFSVMGPGAIYLSDGNGSLAITGTRAGHFTMCAWDGERWR